MDDDDPNDDADEDGEQAQGGHDGQEDPGQRRRPHTPLPRGKHGILGTQHLNDLDENKLRVFCVWGYHR